MGEAIRIVGLGIVAAVVYGVAMDQVTARVCLEYFTIGHPRLFASDDPTLHALAWGVLASWWVGAALGALLAVAARAGSRPPVAARELIAPVARLMVAIAALALFAGVAGWCAAGRGWVVLLEPLASRVPADAHRAFLADLWAHLAAYAGGAAGGLWLALSTWRRRQRWLGRQPEATPGTHLAPS